MIILYRIRLMNMQAVTAASLGTCNSELKTDPQTH